MLLLGHEEEEGLKLRFWPLAAQTILAFSLNAALAESVWLLCPKTQLNVDVGALDLHSCPAALKHPTSTQPPPAPHATAPTFPEAPAKAVTVGPLAGNFLWSAGNNLTWGLDSTENGANAHRPAPLSLSLVLED